VANHDRHGGNNVLGGGIASARHGQRRPLEKELQHFPEGFKRVNFQLSIPLNL
jgi:hypothetical protein